MAVYATLAQLVLAVGEKNLLDIADRDDDGSIDEDVVAAALAEASEVADGYLSTYLNNLVVVPSLRRAVIAIAYEFLHVGDQSTEDSRLGYERAIAWLKDIQAGRAELPGQPNVPDNVIDPGDPLVESGDRVWSRGIAGALF